MKQEPANVKQELLGHVEESHSDMEFQKFMEEWASLGRETKCEDLNAKMSKSENLSKKKDRECENLTAKMSKLENASKQKDRECEYLKYQMSKLENSSKKKDRECEDRKEQMSKLEDALKKKDRECEELIRKNSNEMLKVKKEAGIIEANSRMNETLIACKNECYELKEKVLRLEEDKKMLTDREARGEERYKKLVEDGKSEREKVAELERAKRKAEVLVELYKQRDIRMGTRVTQLENDVAILLIDHTRGGGGPPSVGVVQISDDDDEEKRDIIFTAALKRKRLEDSHGDLCSTSTVPRF